MNLVVILENMGYTQGMILNYLEHTPYTLPQVKGENFIIHNLRRIQNTLKEHNISTITQDEIEKTIQLLEISYTKRQLISKEDAVSLNENVIRWAHRIQAEFNEKIVIEIFTEGTLNFKKLLVGGQSFFPDDVWNSLSEISMSDLNDACLCLLTQSWTPAVMISLRASEDSIRNLYKIKTGKDVNKKAWNTIIKELKQVKDINSNLLNYLDYVRGIRNTADHPDKIFDQMEAERLFHQVVDMIIVINQELSHSN